VKQREPSRAGENGADLVGNPALLKAFRSGDSELLSALFLQTSPMLRGLLYACGLRSAADVDDALQTVYLRAFAPAARASYSGLSPFERYLKSIARNVVRDLHKSGRARYEVLDPDRAETFEAQAAWSDPRAGVEAAAERELRDGFLLRLAPPERRVYDACFGQGLTERDAAAELSVTRHKVRSGVVAIRRKLARFIKEHGLDE